MSTTTAPAKPATIKQQEKKVSLLEVRQTKQINDLHQTTTELESARGVLNHMRTTPPANGAH